MPRPGYTGLISILAAFLLQMAPLPCFSQTPDAYQAVNAEPLKAVHKNQLKAVHKEPLRAVIAIIIDDIGHNRERAEQMFDIPAPLTFAIIPQTTYAKPLARLAYVSGKEVMVHLPMENSLDRPMENLQLTRRHNRQEFELILDEAVAQVPYATGVNNHMGSALTQMPQAMSWLMRSIRRHQMYFIDSRTTHKSVAQEIADQENLQTASRDVFLDNDQSLYGIDQQFQRLLSVARRQKTAIAIGHPYPATVEYLAMAIPMLEDQGITVVSVSELLRIRRENIAAEAEQQVAGMFSATGAD